MSVSLSSSPSSASSAPRPFTTPPQPLKFSAFHSASFIPLRRRPHICRVLSKPPPPPPTPTGSLSPSTIAVGNDEDYRYYYGSDFEEDDEEEEEEEAATTADTKPNPTSTRAPDHGRCPLLSEVWSEINGESDWAGLLDPMDPLLRSEIIRYGEMAQACYDAFDFDPFSIYCGSCRFSKKDFFHRLNPHAVARSGVGYNVTRYLYATSNINLPNFFKRSRWPAKVWSKHANWIGYVAVSDDETSQRLGRREIAVAWRGTVTRLEWIADLMDFLVPVSSHKVPCPDPNVKAESGFLCLYTDKEVDCRFAKYSAREQILTEVKRLIESYPDEELSITMMGHSLGSALAILSAYDIAETGLNVRQDSRAVPICVFSFAGPRVGNVRFKERVEALGVKVLRVLNGHDVVPKAPGLLFNERAPRAVMKLAEGLPWSYSHVGVELELDHENSPFLKHTNDPACIHNLEAHLHLLDGYHGKGHRFVLSSGRDPALVNKDNDFLKDHYMVPPFWRQAENKGLIRNHEGRWTQPERPKPEDHPSDMHHHVERLGLHLH